MTATVGTSTLESPAAARRPVRPTRNLLRSLTRSRSGTIGFVLVALIVLVSLVGPLFTPDTLPTDTNSVYLPPSGSHWLGTDSSGRDVLVQVINGGRTVIVVGFAAAVLSTLIAIVFGSLAAYLGGVVDTIVVAATDIVLTVPQIALLAVLSSLYHLDNTLLLAGLIGILSWPTLLRAVRAQVLSLREREYVEAAQLLDLGTTRILSVEILPNMASFIVMNFMIGMTNAIYALVGLYFLGLAPLAGHNWGIMLNEAWTRGAIFDSDSVFYILSPVIAISLLQLGLVMMTRSLEELLNPRLRQD
ncbi:MAG TPA: ABC transporter permease [Actinocatenispora sp.]